MTTGGLCGYESGIVTLKRYIPAMYWSEEGRVGQSLSRREREGRRAPTHRRPLVALNQSREGPQVFLVQGNPYRLGDLEEIVLLLDRVAALLELVAVLLQLLELVLQAPLAVAHRARALLGSCARAPSHLAHLLSFVPLLSFPFLSFASTPDSQAQDSKELRQVRALAKREKALRTLLGLIACERGQGARGL